MTTTSKFLGMRDDGKPSSRVLQPPGGGSSNIFGPPEPVAPSTAKPYQMSNILGGPGSAEAAAPAKASDCSKDRVFGDGPQKESPKPVSSAKGQDCAGKQDDKPTEPKPQPTNNTENKQAQGESPQERPVIMYRSSTAPKPQQRGNFNPITGQAYSENSKDEISKKNSPGGAYNPITGESYDKAQEKSAPSTRGRQPPGGASSGIF